MIKKNRKNIIQGTSVFLLLFLFLYIILSILSLPFYEPQTVSAITEEEVYQGLGIAVFLYLLSRLGGSREIEVDEVVTNFNSEEKDLFVRIINAEARGEPFKGQVAVGAVVLNRIQSDSFPDNIEDVIYQDRQFSPVSDGSLYLSPTESAYKAAGEALEGNDPSRGALYFYNPETATTLEWLQNNTTIITRIGNHVFAH